MLVPLPPTLERKKLRWMPKSEKTRRNIASNVRYMTVCGQRHTGERKACVFDVEVPEFERQGIGAALVQGVFNILREQHKKAVIKCPFMQNFTCLV
jgi:hypothetical protein